MTDIITVWKDLSWIAGVVCIVPGTAQEHPIPDKLFNKSMVVNVLGSKN